MDIEYLDIVTEKFLSSIHVANIFLKCWLTRSSMVRAGDGVVIEYRYISQLEETFYQGMRASFKISTYSISIAKN